MENFTRYAVYAAPQPGPLADLAASWLGWDAAVGAQRAHPGIEGLPRPVADLTATPRKYGLHGTLKPPFRLAGGTSRAALEADIAALADRLAPVEMEGLHLSRIGRFLALTPQGDTHALERLAAEVVTGLDRHRAPASEAELARRRSAGLTPAQEAHLVRWGYPYLMDEFRFHFTLTGKLEDGEAEPVMAVLAPLLAPRLPRPFRIADLCLFGEYEAGMFHLLGRYPLTG